MTPIKPNRFDDFFADEAYVSLKNHLYNYRLRRRAIQKQIQSVRGGLILEIGSGISPMTEVSDGIVYSDLSFAAMQKLKRAYQGSVCVVADAGRLPFRAGSFNQIICSEVLEHLPEDRPVLSEIASVLKQGGFLIYLAESSLLRTDLAGRPSGSEMSFVRSVGPRGQDLSGS